jgi:hypothetical protein
MNPGLKEQYQNMDKFIIAGFIILFCLAGIFILSNVTGIHIPFLGKPHIGIDDISGSNSKIIFRIYNSGDAPAENVGVIIAYYDLSSKLLGSKSLYIGKITPGESLQMMTDTPPEYISASNFRIIPTERS